MKDNINPNIKILGVVLTMFDARNNLSHQVMTEVRNNFSGLVFSAVIPRNVRLSEAPSHGKPIILYDVTSKGATSYIDLARELMAVNEAQVVDNKENNIVAPL